ncbi:helix-turn-helix domain-containing protein [Hyphomicrobium sp.]|uniref:helix-turn-helix domain-containing protein n=1 Tax=Hyphomicrobium sp. TaxID=82 RepID=UPI003F6FA871
MGSASAKRHGSVSSQFRLALAVAPGNQREFDLWRFGLSPMFAVDAHEPRDRSSFRVDATSYQFADIAICRGSSSAAKFERSAGIIARSGLDNICLNVYLAGGCELDIEGRPVEVMPGDVYLLDLTRRSKVLMPDYSSLSVILPRSLVQQFIPNVDSLHGLILRSGTPLAKMLFGHLQLLFAEAPAFGVAEARAAAGGTAALIATFAGAMANGRDADVRTSFTITLQLLRQAIEENLRNPDLGPDFLTRKFAMSRASLYRLFEPIGGVREYIQMRRLTRAYQMIVDPALAHMRIGSIAAQCGFRNDTVFGRAFREAYGMASSDLRRVITQPDQAYEPFPQANEFVMMNRWLIGMDAAGR